MPNWKKNQVCWLKFFWGLKQTFSVVKVQIKRPIIKSNHTFCSVFNLSFIFIFIYIRFSRIDTKIKREAVFWLINIFHEILNHFWHKLSLLNKNWALPSVDLYLNFEKSSWKTTVQQTGFLAGKNQYRNWFYQATQAVKIQFEVD